MRSRLFVILASVLLAGACARPLQTARTHRFQPTFPEERAAREREAGSDCSIMLGLLPGAAHSCRGEVTAGVTLSALAATELVTAVAVGQTQGYGHPGASASINALQNLLTVSLVDPLLDKQLASRALYVPQDSLTDLVAAPFNIHVMKRADVVIPLLLMVAAGVGATAWIDQGINTDRYGNDPNVFGREFSPGAGYSLGSLGHGALYSHVAVGEELLFRGTVQSGFARRWGQYQGWAASSVLFGLAHTINAASISSSKRARFLAIGVPFITITGSYFGLAYKRSGYSLAVPTALHFWYNTLLTTTFHIIDPESSPLSAAISLRF